MQQKYVGLSAILAASVIWAIEPIFAKLSYANADFLQSSTVRAVFAMLTALVLLVVRNRSSLLISRRQVPAVVYIAVVGTLVADLLYFLGLTMVPVINAVLIGHMQPIFILVLAWFLLRKDVLTWYDYLGILLMIVSAVFVTSVSVENLLRLHIGSYGDGIVLVATVAWASAAVVMRRFVVGVEASLLTFYRFGIASVVFVSVLLVQGRLGISNGYQVVLGVLIGCGTVLYYEGLKRLKAAQVGALELSTPLFAAVLGFFVLGEAVTLFQIVGIFLLLAGIFFLAKRETEGTDAGVG